MNNTTTASVAKFPTSPKIRILYFIKLFWSLLIPDKYHFFESIDYLNLASLTSLLSHCAFPSNFHNRIDLKLKEKTCCDAKKIE